MDYTYSREFPLEMPLNHIECVCVCVCVWGGGGYQYVGLYKPYCYNEFALYRMDFSPI